jgi:pseudouridine-5'-phosphate glycosidase/pseudouridine kinase
LLPSLKPEAKSTNNSEPTSTLKSTGILPAIAAVLQQEDMRAPITYCTPNLLELTRLYEVARSEQFLENHPAWWSVVDNLNLGSVFRNDLEQLSRRPVSDRDPLGENLSFLLDEGYAQKAIYLLPFFQHLLIKCGDRGALVVMRMSTRDTAVSGWKNERSNPIRRYVVAEGKTGELLVIQHFPSLPVKLPVSVTGAGDSFVGALLATLVDDSSKLYHPKTLQELMLTAQKAAVLTLECQSAVSPLLSKLLDPKTIMW